MKIYRLEMDQGIDNSWTVGYYSTLDKAISKAKTSLQKLIQEMLEGDLNSVYSTEVVLDDFTGPMVYGVNLKLNERWTSGVYVYQIEVDDND
jgi:hypothetical protein